MPRPISNDLRERIVCAVEEGGSVRDVGRRFAVAPSTVSNLARRYRQTGNVEPDKMGGDRRSRDIETHCERLLTLVAEAPDVTIAEVRHVLLELGAKASTGVIWRFFHRHGFRFKKKLHTRLNRSAPTSPKPESPGNKG